MFENAKPKRLKLEAPPHPLVRGTICGGSRTSTARRSFANYSWDGILGFNRAQKNHVRLPPEATRIQELDAMSVTGQKRQFAQQQTVSLFGRPIDDVS
jgi:hypothetical protein